MSCLSLIWFLDFGTLYSYFNIVLIVGNKIFCFFKKWVFTFLDEGTFQGRAVKFSKILRGLLIKEESNKFRIFGLAQVKRGEVNISGWGWYPGGHYGYLKFHVYSIFVIPTLLGGLRVQLDWVVSTTCPFEVKPFCLSINIW